MTWGRRAFLLGTFGFAGGVLPAWSHESEFASFLERLRAKARAQGIREATLEQALAGLKPLPEVIRRDRRQPERRLSFRQYRRRVLTPERIARGRELYRRHRRLLARTERRYGVPAAVLVALWGIESAFGRITGDFPVIAALATLAFDGRRRTLFERELLAALTILDRGEVAPARLRGSWAGAMGQPQFMPTTYLRHAVDADGDGRRDIWQSLPDVFASMANFLRAAGWQPGWRWGRELAPVPPAAAAHAGLERHLPLTRWRELGLRRHDGSPLPAASLEASLVLPDGPPAPAFLAYPNFRVLLRWNRSVFFAAAVGLLADAVAASREA